MYAPKTKHLKQILETCQYSWKAYNRLRKSLPLGGHVKFFCFSFWMVLSVKKYGVSVVEI
jgi:hypothetical protein